MNLYTFSENPGHNFTPDVVEALRALPDGGSVTFAPGTYDFYAEGAEVEYLCPVCNKSGDKRVIFPVFRKRNVTIDGAGADFVFHDRVTPFVSQKTDGVTFKNFTVNFSFPRYIAASVKVSDDGIFLAFDRAAAGARVNADRNLEIAAGDTVFSTGEKVYFLQQGTTVCYLAAGRAEYSVEGLPAAVLYCDAETREDGIFLRYRPDSIKPFSDGKIVVSYDEARDNDAFFFDRCKNVKVEGVSIYRTAGMGIVTQLCENVELSHICYQAGKCRDEVYSTTADGLFFTNDTGKVYVHDCKIRDTMDDAVSIHNIYAVVEKTLTENKVLLRYHHKSHSGFNPFLTGDLVVISDADTKNEVGTLTVKSSCIENDTYEVFVAFEEPVAGKLKVGDYVENHLRSPEVVIENCVFDNFPHVRLASAKPIAFRGNTVTRGGGVIVNDLMTYWYAYGKSDSVTVIGNTFENCEVGFEALVDRAAPGCTVRHGDVRVLSNEFRSCGIGIHLCDTERPTVTNNYFHFCPENEKISNCGAVSRPVLRQLLMRRDSAPVPHTPLPEGYVKCVIPRGSDYAAFECDWHAVAPLWPLDLLRKHLYDDPRVPDDGFFRVKNAAGEVVGHSHIQLDEHKPGTATVHEVAVKSTERGKRLGYVVSEMVLDYAEAHGIPTVYLTTDEFRIPAIKIYLSLGFRPVLWDGDMRERWFPILRALGVHECYDERDERLISIDDTDR